MKIRLGTRKSNLAIAQAEVVAARIKKVAPECVIEIHEFTTSGDSLYNANLTLVGGKGLFVKEIEEALLSNEIDIAVHSMKDVPAYLPEGLIIDCILEREDANDVFISERYNSIQDLPRGAVLGTSSLRRRLQLLSMRPDLNVVPFRGNVNTRLAKLKSGDVDAIVLAYAGLKRLGLEKHIKQIFTLDEMLPAVAQGAIGIETRSNDREINQMLQQINHKDTYVCINVEREFMIEVSDNCTTPMAAHAIILNKGDISFRAGLALDGSNEIKYQSLVFPLAEVKNRVRELATELKE